MIVEGGKKFTVGKCTFLIVVATNESLFYKVSIYTMLSINYYWSLILKSFIFCAIVSFVDIDHFTNTKQKFSITFLSNILLNIFKFFCILKDFTWNKENSKVYIFYILDLCSTGNTVMIEIKNTIRYYLRFWFIFHTAIIKFKCIAWCGVQMMLFVMYGNFSSINTIIYNIYIVNYFIR